MNSRDKGKRGELELCAKLREAGFEARRAQQFCGVAGDEDVAHSIAGLHIECKRVEHLNMRTAYAQAAKDAKPGKMPVVMHRCNKAPWMVTLCLDDFLQLIKADAALD